MPAAMTRPAEPVLVVPRGICPAAVAAERMLAQCAAVIAGLDDHMYTAPSRLLPGGTVGRHIRHVLDHFAAALAAVDRPEQAIDYDHRRRDVPEESCRRAAASRIGAVRDLLSRVDGGAGGRQVRVSIMLAADGACTQLGSTLSREVAFAAHHATHHYAMIGAICREHGASVPEGFGKAPATLNHEQTG